MADTKRCCKRSDDKISMLPDEILCHILSSLPSKDAVRTTILSKRWSSVWTLLPNIHIDDRSLNITTSDGNVDVKTRFMDSVDTALHRLNDLKKLSLKFIHNYDPSRVTQWMNAVFMHDSVDEFVLEFDSDTGKQKQCVEFPISSSSSKKMVILKLKNLTFIVPLSIYLPSVKTLHLNLVYFRSNDDFMKNLIDACPVLEELYIRIDDNGNDGDEHSIGMMKLFRRPSSLKSLRVDTQYACYNEIQLRINNVDRERGYTKDFDRVAVRYDVNSFFSLLQENLDHRRTREGTDDDHDSGLLELISKLSNTKQLFVSRGILECLTRSDDLPMFLNLTHLVLPACDDNCLTDLPYSLESSPNLITFVSRKVEYHEQLRLQSQGPVWLMQKVEEIVLTDFKGRKDDMETVRYFLERSTILKKMSIKFYLSDRNNHWKIDRKNHWKITKKLITFRRKCQLFLS